MPTPPSMAALAISFGASAISFSSFFFLAASSCHCFRAASAFLKASMPACKNCFVSKFFTPAAAGLDWVSSCMRLICSALASASASAFFTAFSMLPFDSPAFSGVFGVDGRQGIPAWLSVISPRICFCLMMLRFFSFSMVAAGPRISRFRLAFSSRASIVLLRAS